jgi:protocatechuate 3,4-dioxygenase beta subunit
MRIALVLSIAAVLLAQEPPPPRLSVSGMVISTAGGPVRKATVILRAKDEAGASYTADSDANGRFVIYDVRPGAYAVSADRQGFMWETDGAPGAPPPSLKVEADNSVTDVKIRLAPLGVITGRVLDDDGDPVRGAPVEAMAYTYQGGKKELRSIAQASANDKGEFRLFGLDPGTFYLRASGHNRSRGIPMLGSFAPTYFPSTTDAAHAAPIDVSSGAQLRGFDIRLRREPHYSVRGKLPEAGHEGAERMLQIVPRGGFEGHFPSSMRQDDETFEFMDLPPGSYVVVGRVSEDGKSSVVRQPVEVVNADVEGVTLNFVSPAAVSGVVRVEGAPPHSLENVRVNLQPETPGFFGQNSAKVKPDGSFLISDVMPDVYEVNVVGSRPGAYMKSIRFGDAEAPDDRIDLTQGSGPVTILLGTDVGEVEGSVKKSNGDPAVRVRITLIAYGKHLGRGDLSRFGFTDEQGKFHLRNVAPGEYKLFAWEDVPIDAPQDPEFRKPFEKQAVAVKMEPNGHETAVELIAISVKASQRPAQ